MDDQVLNTDPDASVQKDGALQQGVAIQDDTVINSINKTTSSNSNVAVTNDIGEADHAEEIATNVQKSTTGLNSAATSLNRTTATASNSTSNASQTTEIQSEDYTYGSGSSSDADNTEQTIETTSNIDGNTATGYWKSNYSMDDQWKATDSSDYSWNKLAEEHAQYAYEQEANQVLADYASSMQEVKSAASEAMDTYFAAKYSANQTADKMGWSGGQQTSNEVKTAFLQMETAANMYSKFELQKYGVETQLSSARLYAESDMQSTALEYYQDAVSQAVDEASLTGYYISPENSEIISQRTIAQKILDSSTSTPEEKTRAQGILDASSKYFDDMGLEKDKDGNYIGAKTLAQLEFEQQKKVQEAQLKLQKQANEIASSNLYYSQLSYELAKKELNVSINTTNYTNLEKYNNSATTLTYSGESSGDKYTTTALIGQDSNGTQTLGYISKITGKNPTESGDYSYTVTYKGTEYNAFYREVNGISYWELAGKTGN